MAIEEVRYHRSHQESLSELHECLDNISTEPTDRLSSLKPPAGLKSHIGWNFCYVRFLSHDLLVSASSSKPPASALLWPLCVLNALNKQQVVFIFLVFTLWPFFWFQAPSTSRSLFHKSHLQRWQQHTDHNWLSLSKSYSCVLISLTCRGEKLKSGCLNSTGIIFSNSSIGHKPQFLLQMWWILLFSCISQPKVVLRGSRKANEVNAESRPEADGCRSTLFQVKMSPL